MIFDSSMILSSLYTIKEKKIAVKNARRSRYRHRVFCHD